MEANSNETQRLQLIESMINKARNNFGESGTLYLVWGFAVLICSIIQFVLMYVFHREDSYYVWFLTWLILIYQWYYLSRKSKTIKVNTYTDDILGFVWICFIVGFFVMMFLLIYMEAYTIIYSSILVMYAMPAFLSGAILKMRPLIIGGICCWVLAIASSFVPFEFHGLLIAAAVIMAWIIPGFYLRKRFKEQNH